MLDVFIGELSGPSLGMKVEIWDENGHNIEDTGEKGDLVVTTPFFSMPITFWGEDGMEKYRKAYFEQFPGVWTQGDFIKKNPVTGGYEILGRSDGVLNPGGKHHLLSILGKFLTTSQVSDSAAQSYTPLSKDFPKSRIQLLLDKSLFTVPTSMCCFLSKPRKTNSTMASYPGSEMPSKPR
jgi:hypothetical protein